MTQGHGMDAEARAAVRPVLAALGMEDADVTPLGSGLASSAWRIGSSDPWSVLRIARGRSEAGSTFEPEHALMHLLAEAGAHVPRPVIGSWQVDGWTGPPFSLTTGLEGTPLTADDRLRAAPALAEFLRLMHAQPVEGFGALTLVDGQIVGSSSSQHAGLIAWARRPLWPVDGSRLDIHAALAGHESLRKDLEMHAPTVRGALARGPGAVLHSDLHEENILDQAGDVGVIDFGEALVGPAAWDFAGIAYFLDWSTADAVIEAYARDSTERARLRADATAIGLCFGVYRWAQDRELRIDEDAYNEAFLRETLSRM